MGFTDFRTGRHICEDLGITPLKLAELCHTGKLAAYHFEDRQQVLASSQCNTRFKFADNTTFTIEPRNKSSIIAISDKSTDDFCVYVETKSNRYGNQQQILHIDNQGGSIGPKDTHPFRTWRAVPDLEGRGSGRKGILSQSIEAYIKFIDPLVRESKTWNENIREMKIKHCDKEYILYYNNLLVSAPLCPSKLDGISVRFYGNDQVFFELNRKKYEIDLEYLELNDRRDDGIKCCATKLSIEKIQDSFGNNKFVLSGYDRDVIRIRTDLFLSNLCGIVVDEGRLKRDILYFQKYMNLCAYLQQYAVDYFRKEDSSDSKPLKLEVDFFIFDYDEYKKRFYYLEDEGTSRNRFFNYICKLVFDGKEICNVLKYELECAAIRDNPKEYMLRCCKKLEVTYQDDKDNLMIIKGYELAIEGQKWNDIDGKLWMHSADKDCSMTFVSRKLKAFERIAVDNCIPFIDAKKLHAMKESEKEFIVNIMLGKLSELQSKAKI